MTPVVIALGSNLGDRVLHLRRAIDRIRERVDIVRISRVHETAPVDAPEGSGPFLNMVVAGATRLGPEELLAFLHEIEADLGRRRRQRNEPRIIDLDLIFYGAHLVRGGEIVVPHPRWRQRRFVLDPLAELRLPWVDPESGVPLWPRRPAASPPAPMEVSKGVRAETARPLY
ncbi:MAG: 2-amino-4-hydroxy-6-hydroxymethyldihydropteridine diphosphokinase [Thermoanaerobaculia bacterium]